MPKRFDSGVSYYTTGAYTVRVHFPEDDVKCHWCQFLKHYDGLNRDKCGLTNEILISTEIIGQRCPLTILFNDESEDVTE